MPWTTKYSSSINWIIFTKSMGLWALKLVIYKPFYWQWLRGTNSGLNPWLIYRLYKCVAHWKSGTSADGVSKHLASLVPSEGAPISWSLGRGWFGTGPDIMAENPRHDAFEWYWKTYKGHSRLVVLASRSFSSLAQWIEMNGLGFEYQDQRMLSNSSPLRS